MALEQRLEVKMLQKLILTPQLQQAIKLLQMPQLELSQTLNQELVQNPFLEEAGDEMEPVAEDNVVSEEEPIETRRDEAETPFDSLMNTGVDDYFDNRSYDGRDLGYFSPDNNPTQSFDQYTSKDGDLSDHLEWQLRFVDLTPAVKEAALAVIGNIDDNGYLQSTSEEIAAYTEVKITEALEAINVVQGFDPSGVGARDLKECLVLQLEPLDLRGSLVEKLIAHNLKDIERRRYQDMASHYGVGLEEIKQTIKVIEGLEPKPGAAMSGSEPIYIKPDVYVVRDGENFRIILNDDSIPTLRINSYYRKILRQKNSLAKDEREYLRESLRSAEWLLKSLDHRNKTIYRVTDSILKFQREFFESGVSVLRPQNLKDVARDLGMHESTISRATSNKYLSCQHGLFGFRFFFSSGLKTGNGTVSSTSVKEMIQKIVDEENQAKPLSDQKLMDILKASNIKVARRTVAKYREELRIPPQYLRKRID
ncbi:MAG: RNA polymerase factor sigma-54 [Thermodesulfovibrionales bacterium]|nr:RNA polymerase factor sigma-54 [Thermodesulfovibrionales bacterium]